MPEISQLKIYTARKPKPEPRFIYARVEHEGKTYTVKIVLHTWDGNISPVYWLCKCGWDKEDEMCPHTLKTWEDARRKLEEMGFKVVEPAELSKQP